MNIVTRVFRLARHPSQLQKQASLLCAYAWFRIRYRFLHPPLRTSPDGPKVLIVNFTDSPYYPQMEGLLARVLALDGARPVVLTMRSCAWTILYYRACGITEFVYYDEYLEAADRQDDVPDVRAFLSGNPSNAELLAYTYDGVNIGANALSMVLKTVHAGSVDLSNPAIARISERMLVHARVAVRAARAVLPDIAPATLLMTETGYTPYGELFAVAVEKGLSPIQLVFSQRLDAVTFKRHHSLSGMVDPISLSRQSWERLRTMPWTADEESSFMRTLEKHYHDKSWFNFSLSRNKNNVPPEDMRQRLRLNPAKKTAVVFSHVVWDASFYYGTNLFDDYDHWLVETVKAASENTRVNWVIKLHPDYMWHTKGATGDAAMRDLVAVIANVGTLPPHITVVPPDTDMSIYSFFAIADYCVTVRGTVGLEFPCFGIPALMAGTGRYTGLGFTEDCSTREEYLEKIRAIHDIPRLSPERTSLARKHAYGLFALRPAVCTSFRLVPLHDGDHVVDHRLDIRARTEQEVANDPGLRAFSGWILRSKDADYLAASAGTGSTI